MKDWKAFEPRLTATLIAGLCAALIIFQWQSFFGHSEPFRFNDIDYYRNAVIDVINGTKSMYDALPYPPFAFLIVWWLAGLPILLGNQIWTAATILILFALVGIVTRQAARATDRTNDRPWLVTRAAGSVALLLITWPVSSQLSNGQLSLVVITLAFIDTIGMLPPRFQGVLVGIAGAIKLTPMIFFVYFLVTGQRRQAAVAAGTFGAATALGWALFPEGSLYFWSHLGRNDQFGDPARVDNLSIHSALARFSTQLGEQSLLWVALGAVVVIAAMWRARGHFGRGEVVEAVLVVGSSATVVAPIAWPHYFTWLPLAAVWLLMLGGRRARFVGSGIIACYCLPLVAIMADNPTMSLLVPTIMVAVPVAIGLFGLPHRDPAPGLSVPASDRLAEARENPVS